ncbi:MAG: VOC family protein [Acidimicrobiia bacterium]|nr:VOC family protein [Acidimicrobiia bacterium]
MTGREGRFRWVDLSARDRVAAQDFYERLFGWTTAELWVTPDIAYTTFSDRGAMVAGLGEMTEAAIGAGASSAWASYVTVTDVEVASARAVGLGATLEVAPTDVFAAGRMAIIADPNGAIVSLWQEGEHIGAERFDKPVSLIWNELNTRRLDVAIDFYTRMFEWDAEVQTDEGPPYVVFRLDGTMIGGAFEIRPDLPPDLPDHWLVYFSVADAAASAALARSLGATVVGPMDTGANGRFAIVEDPQGAQFCIFQSLMPGKDDS